LRALLLELADDIIYEPEDDLIQLTVAAALQRRGRAIRLGLSRDSPGAVPSLDKLRLVHTLAKRISGSSSS